jgi:hypothetical protein
LKRALPVLKHCTDAVLRQHWFRIRADANAHGMDTAKPLCRRSLHAALDRVKQQNKTLPTMTR